MHAHNRDSPVMAHKLPNPGARGFVANQDPLRADVSILTQLLTAVLHLRHLQVLTAPIAVFESPSRKEKI